MNTISLGKYKIIATQVSACNYDFLQNEIKKAIVQKKSLLISPVTSQTIVDSYRHKETQKMINQIDYLPPDSQWIRHALFFLYKIRLSNRVYGPQLMLNVCEIAQEKKYRIYLYGTTKTTLEKLTTRLKARYPKIKICGSFAPKFGELTTKETTAMSKKIHKRNPHIIFLGLGTPHRELLALKLKTEFSSFNYKPVIIPIGAAFDFIAGVKPQAPKWMGDRGLEWLFRLLQEPKRLWQRYLISGTLFCSLILFSKFNMLMKYKNQKV